MPENQNQEQQHREDVNSYSYNPNRPNTPPNNANQTGNNSTEQGEHADTKKVVDTAAKGAAEVFAPGVGGAVYDTAKKVPGVGGAIDKATGAAAEALDQVPGVKDVAKGLNDSGATDAVNQGIGLMGGKGVAKPGGNQAKAGDPSTTSSTPNMPGRKNSAMQSRISSGDALENASGSENTQAPDENNLDEETNDGGMSPPPSDLPPDDLEDNQEDDSKQNGDGKAEGKTDILGSMFKNFWDKHKFAIILGGAGGIFFFLIILIALMGGSTNNSSFGTVGLGGYDYIELDNICETVYVYDSSSGDDGSYTLDEYIAGVVAAEVGGFNDAVSYETLAIAARTYALYRFQGKADCSIAGNATAQAFKETDNEAIIEAVNNTKGLVVTKGDSLIATEYDAFCYSSKNDNYYTLQADLQIPTSWVDEHISSWTYKNCACNANDHSQTACWSNKGAWMDGGHGRGLSQWGTYYLATELEYTKEEILKLFYGDDIEIMSIYPSVYTGEYSIDPNDELYKGLEILRDESLESLLARNGSSVEELDAYLAEVVESSGVGTREAVVNVAVSLIGALADMGYKLNYQWGGKYYNIGVNPSWGLVAGSNVCGSYANLYGSSYKCLNDYKWVSFDCSGFVHWAIANAFQTNGYSELNSRGLYLAYMSDTDALDSSSPNCQAGDVLLKRGSHVALVVGVDEEAKKYVVAESTGSDISTGTGGVKLSYYNYNESGYVCGRLDNIYNNAVAEEEE